MKLASSVVLGLVAVLLLFVAPARAQRVNLDTGWCPSVDYTNTDADCAADAPFLVPAAPPACVETELRLALAYRYRVTVRNLTEAPHTVSGTWLSFFQLHAAPGQPTYNALHMEGCGVPDIFAVLAPNDGLPGGPDEATIEVLRTFTLADGILPFELSSTCFEGNARGGTARRLWMRPTHWWSMNVDGQAVPQGAHWPVGVTVESSEARMFGRVEHVQ